MAENDSRKSMDDVLASIRRIVRAERETDDKSADADEIVPDEPAGGDAPLALTPDMMADTRGPGMAEAGPGAPEPGPAPTPAGPTPAPAAGPPPDIFGEPAPEEVAGPGGDTRPRAADLATFVNAPDPVEDEPAAPTPIAAVPRAEDIRDMVRDAVREELAGGAAEELVREMIRQELADGDAKGLVRDIIKAELTTGEIGANISRNVLRLIRSEIAKANG